MQLNVAKLRTIYKSAKKSYIYNQIKKDVFFEMENTPFLQINFNF
ncbi:hypothetical protein CCYN2B_80008 [Capnocytophaga cynodegmi]|uniref:Uncharacterized protein n=1 Tax=Capnocytophaga cynodegmi TaxID=28189 RepID=A0A0B7HKG6_9FLAO|nr:hypothetical protein CCYN2B_80008 [Capnocytophaga cynodegmi]